MSKLRFTKGEHAVYGLIPGYTSYTSKRRDYAAALRHGMDLLGPTFVCEVCVMCKGTTSNSDGYACRYCEGTGLTQGFGCAATVSQRHQVLIAASRSMLLNFDVEVL